MTERVMATLVLGIVSTGMIIARRWNNSDSSAGTGIAGWTIVILLCIWG